jgi:abequosyltransferase
MSEDELNSSLSKLKLTSSAIRLSICITTFKRGPFIGETLESILPQIREDVELLVVDGASPDNTQEVMAEYVARYPRIRYFREDQNSGVDGDYDKAVGYALGKYCWLMTDDDLLNEGAVAAVLKVLDEDPDLVVVNSEIKTVDMSVVLSSNMLDLVGQEKYQPWEAERAFVDVAGYMSFIGGVVIKRSVWLDRDRITYYGSLFIHVGVVFQRPVGLVCVIRKPLIAIRYGNAMWSPRGFEIWMFMWPGLIWSLPNYSYEAKAMICLKERWMVKKKVLLYRALGGYGREEFLRFIEPRVQGFTRLTYATIAILPPALMNSLASIYCAFINRKARSDLYDLSRSRHSTWLSRTLARML